LAYKNALSGFEYFLPCPYNPTMLTADLPAHPCYLNGAYTPLNEAKVSVLDRGFIFGDGIYEVLPVYSSPGGLNFFRFSQHMARLERSLAELRIPQPLARDAWRKIANDLTAARATPAGADGANNAEPCDYLIYLQVTRGVALRDHVMPQNITPTVFAMCTVMNPPSAEVRASGVACVTASDFRWEKAHIKSTSLLGSVMARQIGFDAGATETVMFRGEQLSEAAASNVWVVKNGVVLGPPKDNLVLEGIRFNLIEEICKTQGIGYQLRPISREEVLTCDELILSSATKEVLPVSTLDGKPVGHASHAGAPGPVYQKLYAGYQAAKAASAT
jgi:D-alanine transaminase